MGMKGSQTRPEGEGKETESGRSGEGRVTLLTPGKKRIIHTCIR